MELPPPRSGDWSAVNRHLTSGGSLEHVPWGNPYYNYIQSLIKKASQNRKADGYIEPTGAIPECAFPKEGRGNIPKSGGEGIVAPYIGEVHKSSDPLGLR